MNLAHDRLNRLAENVPGGLFEYRRYPDGTERFPYFTNRFAALFGVTTGELQQDAQLAFRAIPADEIEAVQERFRVSQRDLSRLESRHRVVLPSGETRWLHLLGQPCALPDGSTAWSGISTDVTEAVAAEHRAAQAAQDLQQAHNRINTIMETAPVGLYEFHRSADGHISIPFASARACNLLGFPRKTWRKTWLRYSVASTKTILPG